MKVAVFRARKDGERTARALASRGHQAVLLPVFEVKPTGVPLPAIQADAVIFTSVHGVEAVATDPALDGLRSVPCFCVGARTARQAQGLAFADVRRAMGDASALVAELEAAFPSGSRFLFATGRHRKETVEQSLAAAGHHITAVVVYEACAVERWSFSVADLLQSADVALHYSRRSAELAHDLAFGAGRGEAFLALGHHCIGADVAAVLRQSGAKRVVIAAEPTEEAVLTILDGEAKRDASP